MKKISLGIFIAITVCTMNACSHLRKEDRSSMPSTKEATSLSQSQSVSQPKKKFNNISQWLFREPAHSESYERGAYRVRDRK